MSCFRYLAAEHARCTLAGEDVDGAALMLPREEDRKKANHCWDSGRTSGQSDASPSGINCYSSSRSPYMIGMTKPQPLYDRDDNTYSTVQKNREEKESGRSPLQFVCAPVNFTRQHRPMLGLWEGYAPFQYLNERTRSIYI